MVANLVPRALFPGFGGGREKRPGDEVAVVTSRNIGCFRWLSAKVLLTDKHLLISPQQRIVSLFIPRNKVVCAVS